MTLSGLSLINFLEVEDHNTLRFALRHGKEPAFGFADCACGPTHLASGPDACWGAELCRTYRRPYSWHAFGYFGLKFNTFGVATLLGHHSNMEPLRIELEAMAIYDWLVERIAEEAGQR